MLRVYNIYQEAQTIESLQRSPSPAGKTEIRAEGEHRLADPELRGSRIVFDTNVLISAFIFPADQPEARFRARPRRPGTSW